MNKIYRRTSNNNLSSYTISKQCLDISKSHSSNSTFSLSTSEKPFDFPSLKSNNLNEEKETVDKKSKIEKRIKRIAIVTHGGLIPEIKEAIRFYFPTNAKFLINNSTNYDFNNLDVELNYFERSNLHNLINCLNSDVSTRFMMKPKGIVTNCSLSYLIISQTPFSLCFPNKIKEDESNKKLNEKKEEYVNEGDSVKSNDNSFKTFDSWYLEILSNEVIWKL